MRRFHTTHALLVIVAFLLVLNMSMSSRADNAQSARPYSGVEVNNLVEVVDDLSDEILQIHNDLGTICGRLNSDGGVTYANYAPTNSGSNTVKTLDRR